MIVKLTVELPPEVVQSIERQLGKLPGELKECDAVFYLSGKLNDHCRDVMTREKASTMTGLEIKRRVYHLITSVMHRGPVPVYGKTDRELLDLLPGLTATKIRWARYWLLKNGYVCHEGKRETGKVWKFTMKPIPNELQELPEGLIEGPKG